MPLFSFTTTEISWMIVVAVVTAALWAVVHFSFQYWIGKKEARRQEAGSLPIVRKILKIFLIILGAGLISYVFVEEGNYKIITENIGRATWIAFMALATIILAAITDNFFQRRIRSTSRRDQQDETTYKYLNSLVTVAIYLTGIILAALAIPAASC